MAERDENIELPESLRKELRGLYNAAMPAGRDREILAAAHHAGKLRDSRWRWLASAGIAAAVLLALGILWPHGSHASTYARTGDIRDAFYVARQLKVHRGGEGGQALEALWDVNHDGVVDEKDVQLLALAAVKLGGAGGEKGVMP